MSVSSWLLLSQEDDEGHLLALQICHDLLLKQKETFLDHFARLGIFHKVQSLVGGSVSNEVKDNEEEDATDGTESSSSRKVAAGCLGYNPVLYI